MKSTLTIVPEVPGGGKESEHGCLDSPRDETPQRHAEKVERGIGTGSWHVTGPRTERSRGTDCRTEWGWLISRRRGFFHLPGQLCTGGGPPHEPFDERSAWKCGVRPAPRNFRAELIASMSLWITEFQTQSALVPPKRNNCIRLSSCNKLPCLTVEAGTQSPWQHGRSNRASLSDRKDRNAISMATRLVQESVRV